MSPVESTTLRVFPHDPSPLLEQIFTDVQHRRMAGIPLVNPRLAVRAVGFTRWQGRWIGALLTPWFLNLIMLPAREDGWEPLAEGQRRRLPLPSGDYQFVGGHEERLGPYLFCSLLSPVHQLSSQQEAERIAGEVMELLLTPTVERDADGALRPAAAPCGREAVNPDRRDFLFGHLGRRPGL